MGAARQPAVLLRDTVNLEPLGNARSERLSSGRWGRGENFNAPIEHKRWQPLDHACYTF